MIHFVVRRNSLFCWASFLLDTRVAPGNTNPKVLLHNPGCGSCALKRLTDLYLHFITQCDDNIIRNKADVWKYSLSLRELCVNAERLYFFSMPWANPSFLLDTRVAPGNTNPSVLLYNAGCDSCALKRLSDLYWQLITQCEGHTIVNKADVWKYSLSLRGLCLNAERLYFFSMPWANPSFLLDTRIAPENTKPNIGLTVQPRLWQLCFEKINGVHRGVFSTSGDSMSTSGDVQYIGGYHDACGEISWVHRGMFNTSGFWYKLKDFLSPCSPTCIMISPRCTEHPPMYSWYPPDVLVVSPRCTHGIPPMYWTSPDVLNTHYAGWLGTFPV